MIGSGKTRACTPGISKFWPRGNKKALRGKDRIGSNIAGGKKTGRTIPRRKREFAGGGRPKKRGKVKKRIPCFSECQRQKRKIVWSEIGKELTRPRKKKKRRRLQMDFAAVQARLWQGVAGKVEASAEAERSKLGTELAMRGGGK